MFCPDCNNNRFVENNTEVTCINCGLVVVNQVLDDYGCDYDKSIYGKETELGELISKYRLSESCEDYINDIYTKIRKGMCIKKDFALHIAISIGFEIDNTYVFDNCKKYKQAHNKACELFQLRPPTTQTCMKRWAHNMKLFQKLLNKNKDIINMKNCYKIYEQLPNENKELVKMKEQNIFLTIIFINAKSINPKLKTIDFAKQNEISTTTILKTQKLITSLLT